MTLVCFAMKEEAKTFSKVAPWLDDVSILVTGIGQANSARSVDCFLEAQTPSRVFTCGFAGGLNPALGIGEVVFETSDPALVAKLNSAGARPTKFFCAARIATTAVEKQRLRDDTGADAVEMESSAIHTICRARGIPCATVRAISDAALDDLPLDFNQLSNPDLSLNYGKLAFALAKSPGRISALLRLQKHCRLAAGALAQVLLGVCAGPIPGAQVHKS